MSRFAVPGFQRISALVAILAAAALWGISNPPSKSLLAVHGPCTLAELRLLIALAVLLPFLAIRRKRRISAASPPCWARPE
ncbi:MAG: EamA family transporter [Thermomicrobiales bacterium]|nr:EamA family transporter [Thermomicrobiales bacterium]